MLDLKSMRYFVAVVEEGSITQAAERLGLQQPPLSAHMKTLEQRLGIKLLTRLPRGVTPTPAGNALYEASRKILADTDRAIAKVRSVDRAFSGQLQIGVTRSVISHPMIREAISSFVEQHELAEVSIVNKGSLELCSALADNEIDLAIARPQASYSERLRCDDIVTENIVAALPRTSKFKPCADKASVSLKELSQLPAILYRDSTDPVLYNEIMQAFRKQELTLATIQETPSTQVALDLVSTGLGFTLVPQSHSDRYSDRIIYHPLEDMSELKSAIRLYSIRSDTGELSRAFRLLLLSTVQAL